MRFSQHSFLNILLQSYRSQGFAVFMLISSLIVASAGLSAVLIINQSAKQSYSSNQQYFVPNVTHNISARTNASPLTKADYSMLRQNGFTQVVAIAQRRSHVYLNDERKSLRAIDFTGVDSSALISLTPNTSLMVDGDSQASTERFGFGANNLINYELSAFAHPTLIESLDLPPDYDGQLVGSEKELLPKLIALEADFLGNDVVMDMSVFYSTFPQANLSRLLVVGELSDQARSRLNELLPAHLALSAINQADQGELTKSFHLNLLAMALLMFAVCLFIVLNAAQLLLNKRMPWLKVCRQIGIGRWVMIRFQLFEIICLGALACLIGVFIGAQLALLVSPAVQATIEGLYQVQVGFGSISFVSLFLKVYGISLVGLVLAFLVPLQQMNQRLSQKNIVDISWRNPFKQMLIFVGLAFTLIVFAGLLFTYSAQLSVLLIATAALILAGCGVLLGIFPYALALCAKLVPERFILLKVSVSQSLSLSTKTKVACCAFFIAATSNIGMNLMVDSFRGATDNWLTQRLASDHYLYYNGDIDLVGEFKKSTIDGVEIIPRYEHTIEFNNQQIPTFSYPSTPTMQKALVFESVSTNVWQDFELGKGVFINQQFSIREGLKVGDSINLNFPFVDDYTILGVIYDYGNPSAQVLFSLNVFESYQEQAFKSTVFAINGLNKTPSTLSEFKTWLSSLDIDEQRQLLETQALLTLSMETFDRTFIITDGLNIVTLLVAALSLACAIIVLMDDSRPQRMLLRSFGVSTFKNQLLAYSQYLVLCIVALALATPFGILLSWVLIYEINYQAFQWTYPLQINWLKLINVYWLSLLVVSFVILLPIIRMAKRPLIEDIRLLN
jgi:putative ABC transport system permease protein